MTRSAAGQRGRVLAGAARLGRRSPGLPLLARGGSGRQEIRRQVAGRGPLVRRDPPEPRMNRPIDLANPPPCPITGAPGSVLVEEMSPKFLTDLWRRGAGVDPAPL